MVHLLVIKRIIWMFIIFRRWFSIKLNFFFSIDQNILLFFLIDWTFKIESNTSLIHGFQIVLFMKLFFHKFLVNSVVKLAICFVFMSHFDSTQLHFLLQMFLLQLYSLLHLLTLAHITNLNTLIRYHQPQVWTSCFSGMTAFVFSWLLPS